jgi:hypothetical protein
MTGVHPSPLWANWSKPCVREWDAEASENQGWTSMDLSADDILRFPAATITRIRSRLRASGAPF